MNPMEIFGTNGAILEGRLFRSFCESNAFGNASTARNTAITNAAKKAKVLKYPYFTIIWDNVDQKLNTGSFDTTEYYRRGGRTITTHQYNTTFYTYDCVFIILNQNELEGWDNIYSVSNYVK
jgi:hypothetical protein